MSKTDHNKRIPGKELKAFVVAYTDFMKSPDLSAAKKKLENYDIEIKEDEKNYIVNFHVLNTPGTITGLGGQSAIGRDEQFTISKSDYHIVQKVGYR